jgi:hypothetical protein
MLRKALAGGLLIAVCLGFLAVEGISQAPPPPAPAPDKFAPTTVPLGAGLDVNAPKPAAPSFHQLVQELKNVRAQQETLKAREKELLDQLVKKVAEQRKELLKSEQLLRELLPSNFKEELKMPGPDRLGGAREEKKGP